MLSVARGATFALLLPTLFVAPASGFADDWPQFRGPDQGRTAETNLPVSWSATENVRWKTPLPGPGHSSPIIWGDRIFLTAFEPASTGMIASLMSRFGSMEGRLLVLSLHKQTGRILWEREVVVDSIASGHSTNAPASPTPVTDGELVYVYFGQKGLTAFDFDGDVVWEKDLGTFPNEWGFASSPVLHGDKLILVSDSDAEDFLLAVDKKTGKELWRTSRNGAARAWPVPVIWNEGGEDQIDRSTPYIPSPVVLGDYFYMVRSGGVMTCLNARTGEEVWQERLPARGDYYASLIAAEDKIYALSEDGEATVVAAGPQYRVLSTNSMGARTMATPAVSDGQLFIRTDETLFAIGGSRH